MTTLITGAGGQVGHDLVAALAAAGHAVIGADIVPRPATWTGEMDWEYLDITDRSTVESLLKRIKPCTVFHLAAVLSARAEESPELAQAVNQTGLWNILEGCRASGVRHLIFPSSIAAFGPGIGAVAGDDEPMRPTTLYGIAKVGGELMGQYYFRRWGLDFRSVRFPGLISAAKPGGGASDYAVYMYTEAARTGAYEAYCRPQTRIPLMYMPDAVQVLLDLSRAEAGKLTRRVYNVAAFSPTARQIADEVERALPGAKIAFSPDPVRQAILDSWPRELDDGHARRDWGWNPKFDLRRMSEDLIGKIKERAAACR